MDPPGELMNSLAGAKVPASPTMVTSLAWARILISARVGVKCRERLPKSAPEPRDNKYLLNIFLSRTNNFNFINIKTN